MCLSFVACACGEEPPPPTPAPPPPPPPAPIASSRPVAEAGAFALVPTGEGALLVWGAPYSAGGGVRALPLGPLGEATGSEQTVAVRGAAAGGAVEQRVGHAVEVAAAASGRRVGVAWVMDHGEALETEAAYSVDGGRAFGQAEPFGPSVRLERDRRGRVVMSASEELGLVLQHRVPEGPCVATSGSCALLHRAALGPDASEARRGNLPLEIQRPCDPLISGALAHRGTSYYAICHEEPAPRAMVYVIRPDVTYAAAIDSADGCLPAGLAPLDDGVAALTRCGEALSALVLDEMGRERARLARVAREAVCEGGRPVLRIGEGQARHSLRLGEAQDHVEALLPEAMAPEGARAIWTGEALLVAAPIGRDVSLRRYQCVRDRLDRTDVR